MRLIGKNPPKAPTKVVVFDLDGCLIVSAAKTEIKDHDFWFKIWSDPDHPCNNEMVIMARALLKAGIHIAILTARPIRYQDVTIKWIADKLLPYTYRKEQISLSMYNPLDDGLDHVYFKAGKVREWLYSGVQILFAIEDYKPNAEQIRQYVPVLLYEQIKNRIG